MSRGVFGTLEGINVLRVVYRGVFYSIIIYFDESQLIELTFSSQPGGPGGLIYLNVPKIRSF